MNTKKIIGYALLGIGLIIIFWMMYSSYGIFTAKKAAPEVFKTAGEKSSAATEDNGGASLSKGASGEVEKIVEERIKEMIPSDFFYKFLNLISWSIFAGIFILGGGAISGIGIKLIKNS